MPSKWVTEEEPSQKNRGAIGCQEHVWRVSVVAVIKGFSKLLEVLLLSAVSCSVATHGVPSRWVDEILIAPGP